MTNRLKYVIRKDKKMSHEDWISEDPFDEDLYHITMESKLNKKHRGRKPRSTYYPNYYHKKYDNLIIKLAYGESFLLKDCKNGKVAWVPKKYVRGEPSEVWIWTFFKLNFKKDKCP